MDFKQKIELPRMQRGQGALTLLGAVAMAMLTIVIVLYVLIQLGTSLNNANLTAIINQTVAGFVNFSAQLPTVGTVGGVALLLLIIGGIGLYGYSAYQRHSGGGGTGM
jgi:hypothetical protein